MQNKQCSKCKQTKPIFKFSKHHKHGYQYWCKECKRKNDYKYRNSTKGKTVRKKYSQSKKGRSIQKIANKYYRQTEKYKARRKRYLICHPEYKIARNVVSNAIIAGKLSRPNIFQCPCGKQAEQYHHYLGYAPEHRLDVIPVCCKCHYKYNKKIA